MLQLPFTIESALVEIYGLCLKINSQTGYAAFFKDFGHISLISIDVYPDKNGRKWTSEFTLLDLTAYYSGIPENEIIEGLGFVILELQKFLEKEVQP